jgi:RNA polymerase sigma-70 factor (subfamily 1)
MAAESAGILQNAKSRQRSLYALAQLGFVDTDKLLNSICRNDFVLGTVPEQCHSVLAAVRARLGAELRGKLESWDVVQDALLASLRNVQAFDQASEGAFLNWLAKIVENRIRDQADFFRADKRDHRLEKPLAGRSDDSSAPLDIPEKCGTPTPSQVLILSEDLARLEKAMDQLPEESRELIVAVKIEGRTYDEIAQAIGKSPDAVRMQAKRALMALANAFHVLEKEGK